MAKLAFQSTITLNNATPYEDNVYRCTVGFSDAEGVFQPRDIQPNDKIFFDTSTVDVGTYTLYTITEIHNVSWTGDVTLSIQYDESNENPAGPPPLEFIVGTVGVVARPSDKAGLLPVVSPSKQEISDTFSFYLLNHNLVELLNNPPKPDVESTKLFTAAWLFVNPADGRAELPSTPIGDFVLDMGVVFLIDGSMAEVVDVKPVFDESTGKWYAQIPVADLEELGGMVGAVTVTYLTAVNPQ